MIWRDWTARCVVASLKTSAYVSGGVGRYAHRYGWVLFWCLKCTFSLLKGLVDLEETSTNATIGHGQEGAAEGASALLVIGYMYASNSEDKDSMLRHAERANTTWGQGQHSCPCADLELLRHRAGGMNAALP